MVFKTLTQLIHFEQCLLWAMSQGYTLSPVGLSGSCVSRAWEDSDRSDYSWLWFLASHYFRKGGEAPARRPIPFCPLRTTIHSNMQGEEAGLCPLPLHASRGQDENSSQTSPEIVWSLSDFPGHHIFQGQDISHSVCLPQSPMAVCWLLLKVKI